MGVLNNFLKLGKQTTEPINEITKEVVISNRLKDDKGNPLKFKIKAMNGFEYDNLLEKHNKAEIIDGNLIERLDRVAWQSELLVESVIDPDLKDIKLCEMYGTIDPQELIRKLLLPGEYLKLVNEVISINGFNSKKTIVKENDEILKAAKN